MTKSRSKDDLKWPPQTEGAIFEATSEAVDIITWEMWRRANYRPTQRSEDTRHEAYRDHWSEQE